MLSCKIVFITLSFFITLVSAEEESKKVHIHPPTPRADRIPQDEMPTIVGERIELPPKTINFVKEITYTVIPIDQKSSQDFFAALQLVQVLSPPPRSIGLAARRDFPLIFLWKNEKQVAYFENKRLNVPESFTSEIAKQLKILGLLNEEQGQLKLLARVYYEHLTHQISSWKPNPNTQHLGSDFFLTERSNNGDIDTFGNYVEIVIENAPDLACSSLL